MSAALCALTATVLTVVVLCTRREAEERGCRGRRHRARNRHTATVGAATMREASVSAPCAAVTAARGGDVVRGCRSSRRHRAAAAVAAARPAYFST